jgi:hypothetical protein
MNDRRHFGPVQHRNHESPGASSWENSGSGNLKSTRSAVFSRQGVIALLLAVSVLVQLGLTYESYLRPFSVHFRGLAGLSSVECSAEIGFGDSFAGHMRFLTKEIPAGARVIQPNFCQDSVFGHQGLMEYFLFPRWVMPC